MGLFKSKQERRMERDLEIKRAIGRVRRQITQLEKGELEWLDKAKRAVRLESPEQLAFMRKSLKATVAQRRMLERQLLTIEAAKQMKDQAETYMAFAESMNAVSASIADIYGSVDLEKTQVNFERAMSQAESMSQRMDLFLEMSKDSVFNAESTMGESLISEDEIDRMLGITAKVKSKDRDSLDEELKEVFGDEADEREAT